MFQPVFHITASIAQSLISIETDRQGVGGLPIDLPMLNSLRETARLGATHFSTQIEGNRLTQAQVFEVLQGSRFPGRERDTREVKHYYRALEYIESLARTLEPIKEVEIRRIHGLVMNGRNTSSPYRDGQNMIRDSISGRIVYMPPESKDVPILMKELVAWITAESERDDLPAPLIAGIAHYQFATIHPYYDGNGRTARLLTTLLLHRSGYGLKGIYNLDEYYAEHLDAYYENLSLGPSHNYYLGRSTADITAFLAYFCAGMAASFSAVRAAAQAAAKRHAPDQTGALRKLDPRERKLITLFRTNGTADVKEIAVHLNLAERTVVALCREWIAGGLLVYHNSSRKNRSYRLAPEYEAMMWR